MRLYSHQLFELLPKKPEWQVVLLSGDEPFLKIEAEDFIRQTLKKTFGFTERVTLEVNPAFNWADFQEESQSLSLFSEKRLLELRFLSKPNQEAQKALMAYGKNASSDNFLLVSTPRLTQAELKRAWVKVFSKLGAIVPLYAPKPAEYPRFIAERARQKGLSLSRGAVEMLASHNEGNLFALMQELDYLALFYGQNPISEKEMTYALTQSSRFMVFDLNEALLLGDTKRLFRILDNLREENEPLTLINWVLHNELTTLGEMLQKIAMGQSRFEVLKGVWPQKKPLYEKALVRFNSQLWLHLSYMVKQIDEAIKGEIKEDPWNAVLRVAFAFAGRRTLPLSAL